MQYSRTKKTRAGHSGNRKNWTVSYRPSPEECEERKALGLSTEWNTTAPTTQKQATALAVRWRRHGDQVKMNRVQDITL